MRYTYGKTLRGLLAVLCLLSTVAKAAQRTCTASDRGTLINCQAVPRVAPLAAETQQMTCMASDGKGNCTAASGPDGTTVVVVGEGLKVGERMECQDRGTLIDCHAVRHD